MNFDHHPTMCSCRFVLLACAIASCFADELEIYNTKLATSDLQWDKYSKTLERGWEEVSSFDGTYRSTIRSYQVCDRDDANADNWIRSPYIQTRGGKQIYLEVAFSISRCDASPSDEQSSCKETFNIFYYQADSHVASSTFPPWQEHPYSKVDTVAANTVDGINTKTFNFGPMSRKGFYIAIQDQGACMSLISLRVYYHYCPATNKDLVIFPRTVAEPGVASLATATGKCIPHARPSGGIKPRYRCSSDGQWQIPTGRCLCDAGYQSNTFNSNCFACPSGTYKLQAGNGRCTSCPEKSGHSLSEELDKPSGVDSSLCPCQSGYARAPGENISVPCSGPPSQPIDLEVAFRNATSALLRWTVPTDDGGRKDTFYIFECQTAAIIPQENWKKCDSKLGYFGPPRGGRFQENFVKMIHLLPYRKYQITVHARNGAFATLVEREANTSAASVVFQTSEDVPTAVRKMKQNKATTTSISLVWDKPEPSNGVILNYQVDFSPLTSAEAAAGVASEDRGPASAPRVTNSESIDLADLSGNTKYKVRVRARTSAGYGPFTGSIIETKSSSTASEDHSLPLSIILIIILLCLLIFAFSITVIFRYRKTGKLLCLKTTRRVKRFQSEEKLQHGSSHQDTLLQERLIVALPPSGYRIYVDYPDPHAAITEMGLEVNPKCIKTAQVIGSGEFAEVCLGKMTLPNGTVVDVAVKRLKEGANSKDQINFLREASTMAQFNDPNIICLKGVVTKSEPVMIATEYMENKSLDGYLKLNQGRLSIIQLVKMLKGIASGMRYLSNMKYIHRDLAARNILVDDNLNCKVSDFGLSRTLENNPHATYTTQGGKIAIRWTALESILYRKFTSASDVWSYGIVMWEVTSYGEKPYWDMINDDVIKNVQSGMRLPAPMGCPKILHEIMLRCWQVEPQARPTFSEITENLESFLQQPSQLLPDVACQATMPSSSSSQSLGTQNLCHAVDNGEVATVEKWLEIQRLGKYSQQFQARGVDDLEKVCDLTLNDLKSMGINVTLHINKLEHGIRHLKRHLSSSSSSPPPIRSTPFHSASRNQNDELIMSDLQTSVEV